MGKPDMTFLRNPGISSFQGQESLIEPAAQKRAPNKKQEAEAKAKMAEKVVPVPVSDIENEDEQDYTKVEALHSSDIDEDGLLEGNKFELKE